MSRCPIGEWGIDSFSGDSMSDDFWLSWDEQQGAEIFEALRGSLSDFYKFGIFSHNIGSLEAKNSGTPPIDSLQQAIQVSGESSTNGFSSEQDEVFGVSMLFSPERLSPEILL